MENGSLRAQKHEKGVGLWELKITQKESLGAHNQEK
jgi:hypothetical protein